MFLPPSVLLYHDASYPVCLLSIKSVLTRVTRLGEISPFGQFFSHNRLKLTLIRLKFCLKRGFLNVFQKYSKKFIPSFIYKKTIKECPVPLDISIKSNRKHHKTVFYSKSNKNMVGQLFGRFFIFFGRFFNRNIWSPWF